MDIWKDVQYLDASVIADTKKSLDFLKNLKKAKNSHLPIHLQGEINSAGNAVGCHLQSAIDGVRIELLSNPPIIYRIGSTSQNPDILRAKIKISGIEKNALSTFFPRLWNQEKVLEEA